MTSTDVGSDFDDTAGVFLEPLVEEQSIELQRAVLQKLEQSLNSSTIDKLIDLNALAEPTTYHTWMEELMDTHGDEDWHDLRDSRTELVASDVLSLHHLASKTVYYIKDKRFSNIAADTIARESVLMEPPPTSMKQAHCPSPKSEVDLVLNRLTLDDARFAPRGYQKWMAKKVQRRSLFLNDIPGYGAICTTCFQVLTHSIIACREAIAHMHSPALSLGSLPGPDVEIFSHHKSTKALRISAREGCHLCAYLEHSYMNGSGSEVRMSDTGLPYFLEIHQDNNCYEEYFTMTIRAAGQVGTSTYIYYHEPDTEGPSTLQHSNTGAPEVISLARVWLARCLREDRETCAMPTEYLPSRLIKVVGADGVLQSAHLICQEDLKRGTRYLTLSHCWGAGNMVSLTSHVLEDYKINIPFSTLSRTFYQALQTTLWLGHQYIWIDSLCILQDSESDWKSEAAMMGSIYAHSTCTIAATGASDGTAGLFFERSALLFTECPLFQTGKTQARASFSYNWPAPLSERAWAVQEKYLSPRMLCFGADKITWTCRRTEATEGPCAFHVGELDKASFPELLTRHEPNNAIRAWAHVVQRYSSCNLTYWKDRWPAFQGLANEVSRTQGWNFVHGLREHVLGLDLLWYALHQEKNTINLGHPSWSWLNCKGEMLVYGWGRPTGDLDCTITFPVPTSAITTRFTASQRIQNVLQIEGCFTRLINGKKILGPMTMDLFKCSVKFTIPALNYDGLLRGCWLPDTLSSYGDDLWALQITTLYQAPRSDVYSPKFDSEGLVVVAVSNSPRLWRRVGRFWCEGPYCQEEGIGYRWEHSEGTSQAILSNHPYPWNREKLTIYLV